MYALPAINDSLSAYIAEINRIPLLSREEEYALAVRWRDHADIDAAHSLVTANLRFVVKLAGEFRSYGVGLKDLIQEGNIGLMTAVKKFDPDKGSRLITYAAWWIKSFMQEYVLKTTGLVKKNAKALKKRLFYRSSDEIDTTEADIAAADFSLDAAIGGEEDGKTHLDNLAFDGPGQEELTAEAEERAATKINVSNALMLLSDKERFVIEKRILSDEPASLQTLGDSLGVTRERARQIEEGALKKLRKALPEPC